MLLSHLLAADGVESVVVETRSEEYVASRIRAGILEQSTVDLLRSTGLGDRLDREGDQHRGIYLQWPHERHHLDFVDLTGRSVWVYGQTEVQKDLVAARTAAGQEIHYEISDTALHDLETDQPSVTFTDVDGATPGDWWPTSWSGATGRSARAAAAVPDDVRRQWEKVYPYSWFGILADVAPSTDELIYAWHPDGFALHSMRSSTRVPLLPPGAERHRRSTTGPTTGSGTSLATRLGHGQDGWELTPGPITDKSVLPMRSFVQTPMRHGRLFLAGDAAHIVPPTGAKGLNLAVADVAPARARPGRPGPQGRPPPGRRLLRHRAAAGLAVHPLLVVDDHDAAPQRRPVRRAAPALAAALGHLERGRRHRARRELRRAADRLLSTVTLPRVDMPAQLPE